MLLFNKQEAKNTRLSSFLVIQVELIFSSVTFQNLSCLNVLDLIAKLQRKAHVLDVGDNNTVVVFARNWTEKHINQYVRS
jgi:hypothetical protein